MVTALLVLIVVVLLFGAGRVIALFQIGLFIGIAIAVVVGLVALVIGLANGSAFAVAGTIFLAAVVLIAFVDGQKKQVRDRQVENEAKVHKAASALERDRDLFYENEAKEHKAAEAEQREKLGKQFRIRKSSKETENVQVAKPPSKLLLKQAELIARCEADRNRHRKRHG